MNRIPVRVRMTAAFALAMLLTLLGAFGFVYLRMRADLDDRVNERLRVRMSAAQRFTDGDKLVGVSIEDNEEIFVQLLGAGGGLLDRKGAGAESAVDHDVVLRAASATIRVERDVPGVDGRARMVVQWMREGNRVLVVGESLRDRNEALRSLASAFTVGGAAAIAVASAVGFLLAGVALRPVEAMRRRAAAVTLRDGGEGLPLPRARDEIRALGVTLNDMLERLRASYEREARFVADASHELRTPIAVVKTELAAALRAPNADAASEALVAAIDECDRLAQLAEDLLVLARSDDAAGLPVRRQHVDVAALLRRVPDRFADRVASRRRAVLVDAPEGLVAEVDPERVLQAVSNLVDNALRHGSGDITITAAQHNGALIVEVSDLGPGFSDGFAAQAFERFSRGSRTVEGSGLGLAIVQMIATAHGGDAAIVDAAQARVRLTLPLI